MGLFGSRSDVQGVRSDPAGGFLGGKCPVRIRVRHTDGMQAYWLINSVKIYAV